VPSKRHRCLDEYQKDTKMLADATRGFINVNWLRHATVQILLWTKATRLNWISGSGPRQEGLLYSSVTCASRKKGFSADEFISKSK